MTKIIGILGGMGPLATADLFVKIIVNTPAVSDQDHPRVIIDSNSKIPSRIRAILEKAEDPLPAMVQSAQLLERAGASFIIIPCHTAHFWMAQLRHAVNIPIYSIIDLTILHIKRLPSRDSRVIILLASTATVNQGLFLDAFDNTGIELLIPEPSEQRIIASSIDEVKRGIVKSNSYLNSLNSMLARYKSKGATSVLAGCTEISLLLPFLNDTLEKLDPTLFLAREAIALAK